MVFYGLLFKHRAPFKIAKEQLNFQYADYVLSIIKAYSRIMGFYTYQVYLNVFVVESKFVFYSHDTFEGKFTCIQKPCDGYWRHRGDMHHPVTDCMYIFISIQRETTSRKRLSMLWERVTKSWERQQKRRNSIKIRSLQSSALYLPCICWTEGNNSKGHKVE